MKIVLPSQILQSFINEARQNCDPSEKILETLCYFIGHEENIQENGEENYIIESLLFPKQKGTASYVNDNGM